MDVSIFLAKALAIYLVIISIALLCHPARYKAAIMDMKDNQPLMLIMGLLAIIVGALMVVAHNIWVMDWPVLITILGWLALIKGTVILLFPQFFRNLLAKFVACKFSYHVRLIIILVFGIFLGYHGFYPAI